MLGDSCWLWTGLCIPKRRPLHLKKFFLLVKLETRSPEKPYYFPRQFFVKKQKRSMGTLANVVLYRLSFPLSLPAQGILNVCSDHTPLFPENKGHWRYTQKEREWTEVPDFIQFFGYIYRPPEAVPQCLELCWRFQGKRIFGLCLSQDLEWFVWKGYFWSLFLDSRSRVFPCLLLSRSETRTRILAKWRF